jgi:hypothetical protein
MKDIQKHLAAQSEQAQASNKKVDPKAPAKNKTPEIATKIGLQQKKKKLTQHLRHIFHKRLKNGVALR